MELDRDEDPFDGPDIRASFEDRKNVYATISDFPQSSVETRNILHCSFNESTSDKTSAITSSKHRKETDLMTTTSDPGPKKHQKFSSLPLSPSGFSPSKSDSENSNPGHTYHNIMGTFDSIRRKFKGLTDSHQKNKPLEDSQTTSVRRDREKRLKSKVKTTERRRSSSSKTKSSARKISVASLKKEDSSQKQDQIMVEQLSSSLPASHSAWKDVRRQPPPIPPLHRHPGVSSLVSISILILIFFFFFQNPLMSVRVAGAAAQD